MYDVSYEYRNVTNEMCTVRVNTTLIFAYFYLSSKSARTTENQCNTVELAHFDSV